MNVKTLQKILEKVPGDFEVYFRIDDLNCPVHDSFEVDLADEKLILK